MSPRAWFAVLFIGLATQGVAKAQEPAAPKPSPSNPPGPRTSASREVDRLVEQLRRNPAPAKPVRDQAAADRFAIYLIDLADGKATLVADQPEPGLVRCGSPTWSHDGRRIAFDATPGRDFSLSRLKVIEVGRDRPTVTDFGPGNCPSFSPTDDRIAFLSNLAGQQGVSLMQADGSGRRMLGDYGIPKWSPDSRQMMIVGFAGAGEDRQVTIMDVDPNRSGRLTTPDDLRIQSVPSWAGPGLIVAAVGEGDRIALLDVTDPARVSLKEVLWRRPQGSVITPTYPIYSPHSRACVFAGRHENGMSLYSFRRGQAATEAKPLGEPKGHELIVNLDFSPDGRYVLYADHAPP